MPTNFNIGSTDVDQLFVTRQYLIDRYPELAGTFKAAGLFNWGTNANGELADNTIISRSSPVQTISGGANWKQFSYGSLSTAACIKTDGTLWMWGNGQNGQLGTSSTINRSSPVQTVSGGTNWKQVSGGGWLTAIQTYGAIKTDGTLWIWGSNASGQLGDNSTILKSSPVQTVSGGTNWKLISAGGQHTAAIKTDGRLWIWGQGNTGQLGDNTAIGKSSPVQTVAAGTNWKFVSVNAQISTAIKNDGTLWIWGNGASGAMGNNTNSNTSSPIQTVASGTNWKQVSPGYRSVAAVKTDGTLWTWGNNSFSQLGDGTNISRSSPVQIYGGGTTWSQASMSISSTNTFAAALKTDGSLWAWGNNSLGQLGDNTTEIRISPVQTITGGYNWMSAQAGGGGMIAIVDFATDYLFIPTLNPPIQTVAGVIGTAITSTTAYSATYVSGTITYSISPTLPTGLSISSSTGVVSGTPTNIVAPTFYTVTAVSTTNITVTARIRIAIGSQLWAWGRNLNTTTNPEFTGVLGDSTTINKSSPVQTLGASTWTSISMNAPNSIGIKNDGTLWVWGNNTFGQNGTSNVISYTSPVQTISGGTSWSQAVASFKSSFAIKNDGTLWGWGDNTNGQLGNNQISIRFSSPIQTVAGGTNWSKLASSGSNSTLFYGAIKTDGTLWLWGSNSSGQLGDNTAIQRSSPVQTVSGGTNWSSVSVGNTGTAAIKTDGTLWTWGNNSDGRLGDNTTISKSSPVQTIAGGTNWSQVSVGGGFGAGGSSSSPTIGAIKTDGTLWLWGSNFFGMLGNNADRFINKSSPVQTISGGSNWSQVSVGSFGVVSIKTDGTLWLWGNNNYGAMAQNNLTIGLYSSPIQTISGGSTWKLVSTGYGALTAIKS